MTLGTALEIVNNYRDLYFCIGEDEQPASNGNKWVVIVGRGTENRHPFRELLSTDQPGMYLPTREEALWAIEAAVLYMALADVYVPRDDADIITIHPPMPRDEMRVTFRRCIETHQKDKEDVLTLEYTDQIMKHMQSHDDCLTKNFEPAHVTTSSENEN